MSEKELFKLIKSLPKAEREKYIIEIKGKISIPKKVIKKPERKLFVKISISEQKLIKYVNENLSTKEIAKKFKTSERTISRRIKEYDLKGLRPPGKKPEKPEWILVNWYIEEIKKTYYPIVYAEKPIRKYINKNTLICTNERKYPKGKYFACCFYFIANYDGKRYIFKRSVQYKKKSVSFNEIKAWGLRNGNEILSKTFRRATRFWFESIIAYEFLSKKEHLAVNPDYRTKVELEEKEKGILEEFIE